MGSKFQQPNTSEQIYMWSHSKKYIVSPLKTAFSTSLSLMQVSEIKLY